MDYNPIFPSFPLSLRATRALGRGVHSGALAGYPAVGLFAHRTADAATPILGARLRPRRTARTGNVSEARVVRLEK